MTYTEKLKRIGQAHGGLPFPCCHYFRTGMAPPYAIWQEDGSDYLQADNAAQLDDCNVSGTTDYFTKLEYDPGVDQIQEMFRQHRFAWYVESVQYEEDTGLIHYEWRWKL